MMCMFQIFVFHCLSLSNGDQKIVNLHHVQVRKYRLYPILTLLFVAWRLKCKFDCVARTPRSAMPEETKGKKEGEKDVEMKDADEKKDKDGKDAKKEKEEPPPKTPRTCLRPHVLLTALS